MIKYESDYDRVFDIIDRPEAYSADELAEILSDPTTREIYYLLSATASAVGAAEEPDADAEWREFTRKHTGRRRRFRPLGGRAASIAFIIFSSIVAVGAGIVATVAVIERRANVAEVAETKTIAVDTMPTPSTEMPERPAPLLFEDETLETIMSEVAEAYGVEVVFAGREAAELHLYYRLDRTLPLDEIISRLNTFERINITHKGQRLIID